MGQIIFLDIDGVLNRSDASGRLLTPAAAGMVAPYIVDLEAVGWLERTLARAPLVRLVATSTWRLDGYGRDIDSLARFCALTRLPALAFHRNWATPNLPSGRRQDEVAAWLAGHPEVSSYVILDDDPEHCRHFGDGTYVQTDPAQGLTVEDLAVVQRRLGAAAQL